MNAIEMYQRLTDHYGVEDHLAANTMGAVRKLHQIEDDILSRATGLTDRLERVTRSIKDGQHINSLGELQGSAVDFDILCAKRQDQMETVKILAAVCAHAVLPMNHDDLEDEVYAVAFDSRFDSTQQSS